MDLARTILDWSKGSDAAYQVGSHLYAGRPVKREWVDNALLELEETLISIRRNPSYTDHDRIDLKTLIDNLTQHRDAMPPDPKQET